MNSYLILYDLISPGQDYTAIHEKAKSYNIWARPTESTWVVVTNKDAGELYDDFIKVVDDNDRLFIVRSGGEGAWYNVRCSDSWLQKNL